MHNLVLSPIDPEILIKSISERVTASILQAVRNEQPINQDCWLNLDQLVEYDPEKRTKATFYGYIHRRSIPFHKRGKRLTFLQSEINEWLKQGRKLTISEIAENASLNIKHKKRGNNG